MRIFVLKIHVLETDEIDEKIFPVKILLKMRLLRIAQAYLGNPFASFVCPKAGSEK